MPSFMRRYPDIRLGDHWSVVIYSLILQTNSSESLALVSHSLKTIFQHKVCTDKLYADSFYKAQKSSHSSFEVRCPIVGSIPARLQNSLCFFFLW